LAFLRSKSFERGITAIRKKRRGLSRLRKIQVVDSRSGSIGSHRTENLSFRQLSAKTYATPKPAPHDSV